MKLTKTKIMLFLLAATLGGYAAFACNLAECGGGDIKCCTNSGGSTYYTGAQTTEQGW